MCRGPSCASAQLTKIGCPQEGRAHAEARKFPADNDLVLRLAPDMLPFTKQIQTAGDAAKGCVARLAGQEIPKFEDNEATPDELAERIRKTRDCGLSVPEAAFVGAEGREITVPRRSGDPLRFDGVNDLRHFALPNFFLLPRHHHRCAAAPCRRAAGQGRLPGRLRQPPRVGIAARNAAYSPRLESPGGLKIGANSA